MSFKVYFRFITLLYRKIFIFHIFFLFSGRLDFFFKALFSCYRCNTGDYPVNVHPTVFLSPMFVNKLKHSISVSGFSFFFLI